MTTETFTCNFCRRLGDTYCTPAFDRMVVHYFHIHAIPSGRVYAMFGKVKP